MSLVDETYIKIYQVAFEMCYGEELDRKDIYLMEQDVVKQKIQQCWDTIGKRKEK